MKIDPNWVPPDPLARPDPNTPIDPRAPGRGGIQPLYPGAGPISPQADYSRNNITQALMGIRNPPPGGVGGGGMGAFGGQWGGATNPFDQMRGQSPPPPFNSSPGMPNPASPYAGMSPADIATRR